MQKRLYKSNKNKMIDGVCAGGSGILAYIIAAIIIPRDPN